MPNLGQHIIYGLIDPNTHELRYVGYTSSLKIRYNKHHQYSSLKSKTHKNNWIKFLLIKGQKAEIMILEEYQTAEELPQAEIELIEYYKSIGCDLTNGTNGGEKPPKRNKPHSKESKIKMSKHFNSPGMTGKKHSIETRNRIKESNKLSYFNKMEHL